MDRVQVAEPEIEVQFLVGAQELKTNSFIVMSCKLVVVYLFDILLFL